MNLTPANIETYYERIVKRAQKTIIKGNVEAACFELTSASTLAYNINFRYSDVRCDDICRIIGEMSLSGDKIDFTPQTNKVVFFDAFSFDNRGLTQQYIRALIFNNIEFLYVFGGGKEEKNCPDIIAELESYDKVTIIEIDQTLSCTEKVSSIYKSVADFAPQKALLHISPWSVEALAAFSQLSQIVKFNINLTDHAYWLGSTIVDYNIEFRSYGATVSLEKRGFKHEQLAMQPYYPITNNVPFQGFPNVSNNKVVIFSGGAVYKVYGQNGTYFDIIKRLLVGNPNVILLFAGGGNMNFFDKFIKSNNFENRIILIGNRRDINEVFKHSDIYLGTYPISGGLMSQFAAINGIPILAYNDKKNACNEVEGIVCHNLDLKITQHCLDEFLNLGKQLCSDPMSRQAMGEQLKKCVIGVNNFNMEVNYLLENNRSQRSVNKTEVVDYKAFTDIYVEVENKFQPQVQLFLVRRYKFKAFVLFPKLSFKAIKPIIILILKKIPYNRLRLFCVTK